LKEVNKTNKKSLIFLNLKSSNIKSLVDKTNIL
jgi:hypothetical protein